jgi:hypothetical protein
VPPVLGGFEAIMALKMKKINKIVSKGVANKANSYAAKKKASPIVMLRW